MTLDQVQPKTKVLIKKISGEKATKRRLMDLGLIPGTEIFVSKRAPLGDPIELKVKNSVLSIRKKDAENIIVD
jgi:ferrous iron transport protein A